MCMPRLGFFPGTGSAVGTGCVEAEPVRGRAWGAELGRRPRAFTAEGERVMFRPSIFFGMRR